MSLFQCDRCGCVENSACSDGYLMRFMFDETDPAVVKSYREAVGLADGEEFGCYCCVCSPIQYTADERAYAPFQEEHRNKWHNMFSRVFLPIGEWETDKVGNLRHKKTGETNYKKHGLPQPPSIR